MNNALVDALGRDEAAIADATVELMERRHADLFARYPKSGRDHCRTDTIHHLQQLAGSLSIGDAEEFGEYRSWLVRMLGARGIPEADIEINFEALADVLTERYGDGAAPAVAFLRPAR